MSDTRRRELERSASCDVTARAALIAERLRTGQITVEQVRTAAYLDDPAARAYLGSAAPERVRDLGAWWAGLFRSAPAVGVRSAFVVASRLLRASTSAEPRARLNRALDLLACPCWWHREAVLLEAERPSPCEIGVVGDLVRWAEHLALSNTPPVRRDRAEEMARSVGKRLAQVRWTGIGRGELRSLLRDDLAPRLLGDPDPLISQDRVAELRAPRTAAIVLGASDGTQPSVVALFEREFLARLEALNELWIARTPGASRRQGWSMGSPRPYCEGLCGFGGVGVTFRAHTWIVESFLAWNEFLGDETARSAMRAAVVAFGQYTRTPIVVWAATRTEAFDAVWRDDGKLEDVVACFERTCGPPGDLDRGPVPGGWFLQDLEANRQV